MNKFLLFIEIIPLIFLCIVFFFLFFLFFIVQYIYISYNLKGICKIIFNDDKYFKFPLEPFNCFFISLLPVVFWRETLNIKKGVNFKKLYGQQFYYLINKTQLNEMLIKYPKLFYIQYIIYASSILFFLFGGLAYILDKYF